MGRVTSRCSVDKIPQVVAKSKRGHRPSRPIIELIVRLGALRRFDKLKAATADLPVKLSWDRRLRERRSSASGTQPERRQTERRKEAPFTWAVADFVVEKKRRRKR